MNHTESCERASARFAAEVAAFEAAHPAYCRHCGGWGYTSSPGCSVPYGSTWVSLPDEADPCPHCSEKGICPICGASSLSEDCSVCAACGWEDGKVDGMAEGPECLCWMNEGEDL